ncbi:MAG: c-type cytochrome [Candidatus Solibacter usitatus]|nr:c-type cytochrome [Candidatus Solibacter usitatus]
MKKNKYLLLISSLGVFALLVAAAVEENFFKEWRSIQSSARNEEGPVPVMLRQVVNPSLRVADRCVSCHVSMAPGEQSVTGGALLKPHKNVVHDPSDYGCTVCHGGQGSATNKEDAHGDVHFWPSPMIPARMSYAGCGTCHATLRVPNADLMVHARNAFERLDCLACHRVENRGGTIRPGGGGMEGPDLSRVGAAGYDAGWYEKHLAAKWKIPFAGVSAQDRELLGVYLSTRVAASPLIEAKAVFHSSGCLGCHKVSGTGGDEGPDLSRAGEKDPGQVNLDLAPGKPSLGGWISEHFRAPSSVTAGSQMPAMGMSEERIAQLTFYVLSLRRRDLPAAYTPKDRMRAAKLGEREFSADGATLFAAFCSGCHGPEGVGRRAPGMPAFPAIGSEDFLSRVSDEFLTENIKRGRPGRRMPNWGEKEGGLRPAEIQSIVAYLREKHEATSARPDKEKSSGEPNVGKQLFAAACSGCHGAKGEGGEGPALNNQVLLSTATDFYLRETIGEGRRGTAMAGFLYASPARRTLGPSEVESIVAFLRTWQKGKP